VRAIRFRYALLVALLVPAGCGGGGSKTTTTAAVTSAPPQTVSVPTTTRTDSLGQSSPEIQTTTAPAPKLKTNKKKTTSPERQPGGAGDETPIATQALFTATGGKVTPSHIRVPPFIAVRVVLQARDQKPYTITVNGKEVAVGEGRTQATLRLDGLRPGDKYVLHPQFGTKPKTLVIVANAEPGP
jgi:hypothetical protein